MIKPSLVRVGSFGPQGGVESAGEYVTRTASASDRFDRARLDQARKPGVEGFAQRLLTPQRIKRKKVMCRESPKAFLSDSFQKPDERGILHRA